MFKILHNKITKLNQ